MKLTLLSPRKSLNKAYLRVKPFRTEIDVFKNNLIKLLDGLDETESEEHLKNDLNDFLRDTFYQKFYINTKSRNDLVIHIGPDAKSFSGVLIEAKKPSNKTGMIRQDNINTKAFHELILYYLRERITNHNLEIRHLIATNIYEWYIFDAALFENVFAQNTALVKQFTDFEESRLSGNTTDFFYKQIAEPFLAGLTCEICFTWFDFREYEKLLRNNDKKDDSKLIALYKLLSPEHLLKLPFTNDSNSLDKGFYAELLHIIGLTETKEGGKKLIVRKKESLRDSGSLIENAIIQIDSRDMMVRIENPSRFGETGQDRLFNVSLELAITWINRILFLKLLEAQLIAYHKDEQDYAFLNSEKLKGFDALDSLFFRVLARKTTERDPAVAKLYEKVPYLNSALFEPTELERDTIFISNLHDDCLISVHPETVLKNNTGNRLTGKMNGLDYIFAFLDAYNFSGEGVEEIEEDNKTLINASVLGLIFEKLNGYKDGSFFTPGFITMYMCHETIRRAATQKFNDAKGWNCKDIEDVYDKIEDRNEANNIINSLKICDPAVGSGHFLVSALNEIIALKSDLNILQDREGRRLKEYRVEVVNDELIVTDEDGELFVYNPANKESQRIQQTLFHEKQTIVENCLFGVDINPNSVKICRLRLWIELLKSAYYKLPHTHVTSLTGEGKRELETLPNIDINIKCGNSLISRYTLGADLKQILSVGRFTIHSYRAAIMTYRNAENKEQKREMERLIATIKNAFHLGIGNNDPRIKKRDQILSQIIHKFSGNFLFEPETVYGDEKAKDNGEKERRRMEEEAATLTRQIEDARSSKVFENAFEWRYEFPEVLNDEGDFIGFDLAIGNPPYIRAEELGNIKEYLKGNYKLFVPGGDIFSYFYELSYKILSKSGVFCFINNAYDKTTAGRGLRDFVVNQFRIEQYIDFTSVVVFEEATTYPVILLAIKGGESNPAFDYLKIEKPLFFEKKKWFVNSKFIQLNQKSLNSDSWNFRDERESNILLKLNAFKKIYDIYGKSYRGIITGLNEAFITDRKLSNTLIFQPTYDGKDIKKWNTQLPFKWMITFQSKSTKERFGDLDEKAAKEKMFEKFPEIFNHLLPFEETAKKRHDKGEYWWELRSCAYYDLFKQSKIIFPNLQNSNKFAFDESGSYLNAPSVFLPTNDKHLLGILNSRLVWYFLTSICVVRNGGFIEVKPQYFEQIPIPEISNEEKSVLSEKVDQILSAKKSNPTFDTGALENEIDQLVYKLYGLTNEEIIIVENS